MAERTLEEVVREGLAIHHACRSEREVRAVIELVQAERQACAAMVRAKADQMNARVLDCGCHHDVEDLADELSARSVQ